MSYITHASKSIDTSFPFKKERSYFHSEIPQESNSCRNTEPVIKCVIKKLMLCQWRYHLKTKTLIKKLRFIMKTVKSFKILPLTGNA